MAPSKKEPSAIAKTYLIFYNFGQVLGWSYLLYLLVAFYTIDKQPYSVTLWDYVAIPLLVFQNAAFLEVVHAATGIVKSNPVMTLFQVASRMIVVCLVVLATPSARVSPGLPIALLAWCITEIIRYNFYGLNFINAVPSILTWLRYTTFIVLYPIGVTGELLCFYWAQDYAKTHKVYSIEMPNSLNFTFSYFYFLWIIMLLYIPLFPQLYLHMIALRRKTLGGTAAATSVRDASKKVH